MIAPRCYLSVQAGLGPRAVHRLAVISQRTKAALAALMAEADAHADAVMAAIR
jgi:hypothetical protein